MLFPPIEGALANPILLLITTEYLLSQRRLLLRLRSYYFKGAATEVIRYRSPESVLTRKGRAFKTQINHIILKLRIPRINLAPFYCANNYWKLSKDDRIGLPFKKSLKSRFTMKKSISYLLGIILHSQQISFGNT